MKKILFVLVILLFAAPTMADVIIDIVQVGDTNEALVKYNADSEGQLPRGFALVLTADSGAQITKVEPAKTGESTSGSPGYGIFMTNIVISGGVVSDWGNPSPNSLPAASVVIEYGSLYVDGANAPDSNGTLGSIWVDGGGDCNVTPSLELLRGGIVLENAAAPDTATMNVGTFTFAPARPVCWDSNSLCNGDSDDDTTCDFFDFFDWKDSYLPSGKTYNDTHCSGGATTGCYNPCADFDQDGDIDFFDFFAWKDCYLAGGTAATCSPLPDTNPWPPAGY